MWITGFSKEVQKKVSGKTRKKETICDINANAVIDKR
jgi:hypothetical protein